MNCREILAGIGATLFSARPQSDRRSAQGAGKPLRITHAVTSLAYMQSYVAQQNGYFAKAGFAPQIIDTGGGGPDVQLVLGGRAELTVNDGAQIFRRWRRGRSSSACWACSTAPSSTPRSARRPPSASVSRIDAVRAAAQAAQGTEDRRDAGRGADLAACPLQSRRRRSRS